jgi:hypothetical protein
MVLARRETPMDIGRPYLRMFMLGFYEAMPHMVSEVMFGFVDGCRAGLERGESLASGLSIIVESRLKQKMQTWPYGFRRNPRVYLKQALSQASLARSAQPTASRRKRLCCVPPRETKALRRGIER